MPPSTKKKFKCLSLYSGAGGLDLGLSRAGFDIIGATDADKLCMQSHQLNFSESRFLLSKAESLTRSSLFGLAGCKKQGELDLLAGGPPCPAFSKSRFYRSEKLRDLDDPNAQETIKKFLDAITWLRPKTFLLENVKGLTYKTHGKALNLIRETANKLGYHVTINVLNAADYGVPQIRERCFVIGSLTSIISAPTATHSKENKPGKKLWVTVGEAIGDLDTPETWSDEGHRAGGRHFDLLCQVPPGDNYLFFTKERGFPKPEFKWRSRYWSFLLKLDPELPSWTIQARRSNNMGPFHWRNRILRIEEVKRLQTFPDKWKLVGPVDEQWRQIGNAVPPKLAEKIGRVIYASLSKNKDFLVAAE